MKVISSCPHNLEIPSSACTGEIRAFHGIELSIIVRVGKIPSGFSW